MSQDGKVIEFEKASLFVSSEWSKTIQNFLICLSLVSEEPRFINKTKDIDIPFIQRP